MRCKLYLGHLYCTLSLTKTKNLYRHIVWSWAWLGFIPRPFPHLVFDGLLSVKMEGDCQCRQKKGPLIERMHVVHTDMNIQKCSSWAYNTKKSLELVHSAGDSLLVAWRQWETGWWEGLRKKLGVSLPEKRRSFGELLRRPLIWNVLMYLHVLIFCSQVPGVSYSVQEKAFLAVTVDSYHHVRKTTEFAHVC